MIDNKKLIENILICLGKIPERYKFKFVDIIKETEKILVSEFNSFENEKWYIMIKKLNLGKYETKILQGILFHELGHYFFREIKPTQKEVDSLEKKVDDFVIKNWHVKEEINFMRKNDGLGIFRIAESCSKNI